MGMIHLISKKRKDKFLIDQLMMNVFSSWFWLFCVSSNLIILPASKG